MTAEQFGPYVLESLLGVGGMGEVHRAHDTRRDRRVALKLLPESAPADGECLARFRREQQIAARLTDPHIVPIHDFGEIDGRLFLDMRLVEGRDLGQVLGADGSLDPERAVALLGQVAEALDAAHADDLVHRDVKPSNILVTANDFAYVVDFGIARFLGTGQPQVTAVGTTVGTIAYMAPERFTDDAGDGRADVYALACVLFECVTGRRPFVGEDVAIIGGHLHGEPPRASSLAEAVPEALDAVIRRGMAKAADDRYAAAGEFMAAAREALRAPAAAVPAPETAGGPTAGAPETGVPRATGAPGTTVPPPRDPRTPAPVRGVPVGPGPGTPLRGMPVTGGAGPRRSGPAAYGGGPQTPLRGTPTTGGPGTPLRGLPVAHGSGPGTPLQGVPVTPGPAPGTSPHGVPATGIAPVVGGRSGPVLWDAGPGRAAGPHPADVMPAAVPAVPARPPAATPPPRRRTRMRPRLLLLALVAVLVAGGVAMLRGSGAAAVLREPVGTAGDEPFMPAPGADGTGQPLIMNLSATVTGDEPGLYGGTRTDACNSGQIASFLAAHPDHAAAWAGVQGVAVNEIPSFLATLTPVTLRTDTAVTNHGFRTGEATEIHSVLQAGTGVLVDAHGVPRVRCYCGNPLGPPTADSARFRGANWPGFSPGAVTTIRASTAPVTEFVVVQQGTGDVVARPRGSDGEKDHPADAKDVARVKGRDSGGGGAGHGAAGGRGPTDSSGDATAAAVPPGAGAGTGGDPGPGTASTGDPTGGAATGDPAVPGTGATDAVVPPGGPAPSGGTAGQGGSGSDAGTSGTGSTPGDTADTGGAGGGTAAGGTTGGSGTTGSGTTGGGTTGGGTSGGGTSGGGTSGGGTGGSGEGASVGEVHDAVVPRSAATVGP